LAAGHKTLVPALIESLRAKGASDIVVVVGGVVPVKDYDFLRRAGVAGIFGPGTPISVCARQVLAAIKEAGVLA
jgi:methylmalonyl-CoA mutase